MGPISVNFGNMQTGSVLWGGGGNPCIVKLRRLPSSFRMMVTLEGRAGRRINWRQRWSSLTSRDISEAWRERSWTDVAGGQFCGLSPMGPAWSAELHYSLSFLNT